jgi:AcrR family transcriptional regulator/DNA-binding MarR family transcriptional regulator
VRAVGSSYSPAEGSSKEGLRVAGGSHPRLAEIQRARLISAAIRAVDEFGYTGTSVAHITARARVSRRTFYELFPDCEACLAAALRDIATVIEGEVAAAELDGLGWRERVRMGLWAILSFFDREPVQARVCVVQALRGGPEVIQWREQALAQLAIIVEGRGEDTRVGDSSALTAEGLVGAAFAILYTRLLRRDSEPLSGLLGELMALIVLPYLGPAAARREQARPLPVPSPGQAETLARSERLLSDPLEGLPIRLTYRTTRVLECVAADPGASNRRIGDLAGMSDQGQVSKLLARLERTGLLRNAGKNRPQGEANAWELTARGRQVTQTIRASAENNNGGVS